MKPYPRAAAFPGMLTLLMLLPMVFPRIAAGMELDRDAPFRWISFFGCHLVHFSWRHFFCDAAVFLAAGTMAARREGVLPVVFLTLFSAASVSFALPRLAPEIAVYRGISGVDTALTAFLAFSIIRRESGWPRCFSGAALAGIILKSGWEFVAAESLFAGGEGVFEPVAAAHLTGLAAGCVAGVIGGIRKKFAERLLRRRNPEKVCGKIASASFPVSGKRFRLRI